jgi:LDH2 family malate/lactate/ureidoglycolate dehydrogenase
MLEMLAGVLVGAAIMDEIPIWFKDTGAPVNIGHLFVAIDIERFTREDIFKNRLIGMIDELSKRCFGEGICTVCMPGEVEEGIEKERRGNGIPFSDEVWDELLKMSSRFGEPLRAVES